MNVNGDFIGMTISLIFLFLCMGIIAAFLSANKLNVELKKKQGKSAGYIYAGYYEQPYKFITALIIGALVSIVAFVFFFQSLMKLQFWTPIHLHNFYLVFVFNYFVAAFILVLFSILLPRFIFLNNEKWLFALAPLASFIEKIFSPLTYCLSNISRFVLIYLFNVKIPEETNENTIKIAKSFSRSQTNLLAGPEINEDFSRLFDNALSLTSMRVKQSMIPRTEIIGANKNATIDEVRNIMVENNLSRLVIYDNDVDNIIGYVHQSDFFKKSQTLSQILIPIIHVPETMTAINLMKKFSNERKSMAWVIDEFGGTAGIITKEDILEELFGDITEDTNKHESLEKSLGNGTYIFSGRIELDYLTKKYGFKFSILGFETLSGYIINYYKSIPKVKSRLIIDNYEIEILNVAETRINMVKLRQL